MVTQAYVSSLSILVFSGLRHLLKPVHLLMEVTGQLRQLCLCVHGTIIHPYRETIAVVILSPEPPRHYSGSLIQQRMGCSRTAPSISRQAMPG